MIFNLIAFVLSENVTSEEYYPFTDADLRYKFTQLQAIFQTLNATNATNADYLANKDAYAAREIETLKGQFSLMKTTIGTGLEEYKNLIIQENKRIQEDEIQYQKNITKTRELITELDVKIEAQKQKNILLESNLRQEFEKLRDEQLETLDSFKEEKTEEDSEIEKKEAKVAPYQNKKEQLQKEILKLQKLVKCQEISIDKIKSGFSLED